MVILKICIVSNNHKINCCAKCALTIKSAAVTIEKIRFCNDLELMLVKKISTAIMA